MNTEPQIIETYVATGEVQLVFMPVLNHRDASVNSHAAAECIAQQSMSAFWAAHDLFFREQSSLWRADRDYFVQSAVNLGVNQATFEQCYDSGAGVEAVLALDEIRRSRNVFTQPVFDINGTVFAGARSFDDFAEVIESKLP